jgi:DNA-binding PadR family transcriptional regulator
MTRILEEGEVIRPSPLEVRILIALMAGKSSAYGLARLAEQDLDDGTRVSNGALRPALVSLERLNFVAKLSDGQYKITSQGREVMKWQLSSWKRLSRLARERS